MAKITNKKFLQWMKILHIIFISIWTGGVVCFTALTALTLASGEAEFTAVFPTLMNIYPMIILPAAVLTLIQGLIYSFFTNFGFGKQLWIKLKWLLLVLIVICTNLSINFSRQALTASVNDTVNYKLLGFFPGLQIALLIAMIIISVFKFKSKKHTAK